MERKKIFDILFWVLLIVVIGLILWRIFGDSPTDLQIIIPIMLMMLVKMWSVSDGLKDFKYEVRTSFVKVKTEMSEMKKDIDGVRADIDELKDKVGGKKK